MLFIYFFLEKKNFCKYHVMKVVKIFVYFLSCDRQIISVVKSIEMEDYPNSVCFCLSSYTP